MTLVLTKHKRTYKQLASTRNMNVPIYTTNIV